MATGEVQTDQVDAARTRTAPAATTRSASGWPAADGRAIRYAQSWMTRRRFLFDTPDRFVAGTVGEPGNRTFFLQARDGSRIVSVALEKVQVAALAQRLTELLDELDRRGVEGADADQPVDTMPPVLDEPINEAFRVGTLSMGWDTQDELVLVEAREILDEDERGGGGRSRGLRRRGRGGTRLPAGAPRAARRADVRRPGAPADRRRPAAVPAVRPAARSPGPPLPPAQRARAAPQLTRPMDERPDDDPPLPELDVDASDDARRGRGRRARRRARRGGDGPTESIDALGLPMPVLPPSDGRRPAPVRRAVRRRAAVGVVEQRAAVPRDAAVPGPGAGPRRGLHLQAGDGRAAARRLPGRDARPARGRRVRGLGGDRLGHRAADRAARGSVRRGHGPALDPDRRRRSTRSGWSSPTTSGCGGSPCSTRRSTTPIARPGTCCRSPAATSTA